MSIQKCAASMTIGAGLAAALLAVAAMQVADAADVNWPRRTWTERKSEPKAFQINPSYIRPLCVARPAPPRTADGKVFRRVGCTAWICTRWYAPLNCCVRWDCPVQTVRSTMKNEAWGG